MFREHIFSMPFVSQKDYDDICFGIENGFDFIAASFTRSADDILEIRKIFQEKHCTTMNIIAKIENMQGVENIDEIIRVSDGIMIARGDMGVEIPLEDVPVIQKEIIKKVCNAGKQVITATQMLDSHDEKSAGRQELKQQTLLMRFMTARARSCFPVKLLRVCIR